MHPHSMLIRTLVDKRLQVSTERDGGKITVRAKRRGTLVVLITIADDRFTYGEVLDPKTGGRTIVPFFPADNYQRSVARLLEAVDALEP